MTTGGARWASRGAAMAACAALAFAAQGCGCDASSNEGATAGTLGSGLASPHLIAAGRTQVYVTESDGSVRAMAKADGTMTVVSSAVTPVALAASGDAAAWASADEVLVRQLSAGAPRVVASRLGGVRAVAIDATNVYWTERLTGTVAGAPIAGGATFTLATGASLDGGLAADTGTVYWGAGGAVFSATGGEAPVTVATGAGPVVAIAAAAGHVAWIENDPSGPVLSVAGGTASALAVAPRPAFGALAATSRGVYVFSDDRTLQLVGWGGGAPAPIGTSEYAVGGLAAGDSTVYYTAPNAGQVFQVVVP